MLNIYKASAGSGKTYTLTREYIKFLISEKREDGSYRLRNKGGAHRHILAITFTNKATDEMTKRIIKELAKLATGKDCDYRDGFISELGCTGNELAEASRRALYELLCDYNFFNVSTIDAFFQSVLRIFTREVEVPDNFEVELDNRYAVSIGVGEMLNSINYREPIDPVAFKRRTWLEKWLTDYMMSLMNQGKVFNLFSKASHIHQAVVETFVSLMDETFKLNINVMQDYFSDPGRISKFEAGLNKIVSDHFARLKNEAADVLSRTDEKDLYHHLRRPIQQWIAGENYIPTGKTVGEAVTDVTKRFSAKVIKNGVPSQADAAIISMCLCALETAEVKNVCDRIRATIFDLGLLGALMGFIGEYCRENNLLLLSETNSLLREIINDDETPFIYEKLGYYLNHFLIDEFQDTSPMQWDNLRPLVMESMSRGYDNLVIGDEKQCIYRFRNSDPELLSRHVGSQVAARFTDDNVKIKGVDIADNNNWRSAPEVVKFNNSLFMGLAAVVDSVGGTNGGISAVSTYSNIVQQIPERNLKKKGYVKIKFVPKPEEEPVIEETDEEEEIAGNRDFALEFMTSEIIRQLKAGYEPRDIAVLVRFHSQGEAVINHLLREMNREGSELPRFEIMSNDAMSVGSSPTVKLIISILSLVNIPELLDNDSHDAQTGKPAKRNPAHRRARLINRYERYLHTKSPVTGLPYTPSEALSAALDEEEKSAFASEEECRKEDNVAVMSCPNLPSIVERIITRYVPKDALASDNIFITAFQDLVLDYCSRGDHDIRSFLAWWEKKGCRTSLSSPPDMNALTVMTIHQSKGLEFPCVHIPFAVGELLKYKGYLWHRLDPADFKGIDSDCVPPMVPLRVSPKLSEIKMFHDEFTDYCIRHRIDELNVNYVAFTRATTELIVCSDETPGKNKESFGGYLKKALELMTPGFVDAAESRIGSERRSWVMSLSDHFDGSEFTLGSPTVKVNKTNDNGKQEEAVEKMPMPAYCAYENDNIIGSTRTDSLETFDIDNPRHLGNFLHDVMSRVRHRSDLDIAFERQAYRYGVSAADGSRQLERLRRALDTSEAGRWFEGYSRVVTERWIPDGEEMRRPDRVVWTADGTVDIIDYKFGENPPGDESEENSKLHKRYVAQVSNYARLLRAAGYKSVNGYLWYITDNDVHAERVV